MSAAVRRGGGRLVGALATVAALVALALPLTSSPTGAAPVTTQLGPIGYGWMAQGSGANAGSVFVPNYHTGSILQIAPNGSSSAFGSFGTNSIFSVASDGHGDLFADNISTGVLYKISPTGSVSVYSTSPDLADVTGMAFNSATGTLYVDYAENSIYQVATNGTVSYFAAAPDSWGLALDAEGNLYTAQYDTGSINEYAPDATMSTFVSGVGGPTDVAFGPSGDLYVANYNGNDVLRVTPAGIVTTAVTSAELPGLSLAGRVVFSTTGTLFVQDWDNYQVDEVTGVDAPAPPISLTVSESSSGTVSASWYGSSTDTTYTCTLLYGFNNPSSVTETSSTPSCNFVGLNPAVGYGVEVVANNAGAVSTPAEAFSPPAPAPQTPPPAKHTIVCKKNRTTALRTVTGLHPTCPAGWHRVA